MRAIRTLEEAAGLLLDLVETVQTTVDEEYTLLRRVRECVEGRAELEYVNRLGFRLVSRQHWQKPENNRGRTIRKM